MASCKANRVALLGMSSRRQITGLIPLSSIRSWNVLFESITLPLSRSSLVRITTSSRQYLGLHSVGFTTKIATHRTGGRLLRHLVGTQARVRRYGDRGEPTGILNDTVIGGSLLCRGVEATGGGVSKYDFARRHEAVRVPDKPFI